MTPDQREVCPLSRQGDVALEAERESKKPFRVLPKLLRRRNPYPHHYSTAFAFSLLLYLLPRRLHLAVCFPSTPLDMGQGRQQAYHVPPMYPSG